MIKRNGPACSAVNMDNLQELLYSKRHIRRLAVQLVAGQIEAMLEMINDVAHEYPTFKDVEGAVAFATNDVTDYVEDLVAEFRTTLLEEVVKVNVELEAVIFKPDNEIDIDVVVRDLQKD